MYFDVVVTSKIALRGKKCLKNIDCSWKKKEMYIVGIQNGQLVWETVWSFLITLNIYF